MLTFSSRERHGGMMSSFWLRWSLFRWSLALVALVALLAAAQAQLRGHGGPVRALAIAPDGKTAVSGSFDTVVIRWTLERNAAAAVLRFHDGAVNAVAILPDGRVATSG